VGSTLLLHHVTKLGGTRLNKEVSYVGLSGFGHFASPVLITEASLLGEINVATPTSSRLRTLTTPSQVSEATAPLSNSPRIEQGVFMILPPFLTNAFMLQMDLSPEQLFIEAFLANPFIRCLLTACLTYSFCGHAHRETFSLLKLSIFFQPDGELVGRIAQKTHCFSYNCFHRPSLWRSFRCHHVRPFKEHI
jgi:hypothetical protein